MSSTLQQTAPSPSATSRSHHPVRIPTIMTRYPNVQQSKILARRAAEDTARTTGRLRRDAWPPTASSKNLRDHAVPRSSTSDRMKPREQDQSDEPFAPTRSSSRDLPLNRPQYGASDMGLASSTSDLTDEINQLEKPHHGTDKYSPHRLATDSSVGFDMCPRCGHLSNRQSSTRSGPRMSVDRASVVYRKFPQHQESTTGAFSSAGFAPVDLLPTQMSAFEYAMRPYMERINADLSSLDFPTPVESSLSSKRTSPFHPHFRPSSLSSDLSFFEPTSPLITNNSVRPFAPRFQVPDAAKSEKDLGGKLRYLTLQTALLRCTVLASSYLLDRSRIYSKDRVRPILNYSRISQIASNIAMPLAVRFGHPDLIAQCWYWFGRGEAGQQAWSSAKAAFEQALQHNIEDYEPLHKEGKDVRYWLKQVTAQEKKRELEDLGVIDIFNDSDWFEESAANAMRAAFSPAHFSPGWHPSRHSHGPGFFSHDNYTEEEKAYILRDPTPSFKILFPKPPPDIAQPDSLGEEAFRTPPTHRYENPAEKPIFGKQDEMSSEMFSEISKETVGSLTERRGVEIPSIDIGYATTGTEI